jgi:hypothetical protein
MVSVDGERRATNPVTRGAASPNAAQPSAALEEIDIPGHWHASFACSLYTPIDPICQSTRKAAPMLHDVPPGSRTV